MAGSGHMKNLVETAAGNDAFKTLVAAVKAAGLVETLAGKGPFTVFAPTNEAFAKLPEGTVESLLKPENKDKLILSSRTTSSLVRSCPRTLSRIKWSRRQWTAGIN